MLQREEGASVQAVVEAAVKSNATQKLFLKEENIEYGPLVMLGEDHLRGLELPSGTRRKSRCPSPSSRFIQ